MSLYISSRQLCRNSVVKPQVPILLSSPRLAMKHRTFPAEYEFDPLLQDIFELTNQNNAEEPYFLLPSGCMVMLFRMGAASSDCRLCGPMTSMRRLRLPAGATVFCVRLKAGSGGWLTGSGVSHMTDRTVPLEHSLSGADHLLSSLMWGESFHERYVLMNRYLSAHGAGSYKPSPVVRRCIELINNGGGLVRVSEVASFAGCSERYLSKIFQEHVGLSTKLYSEIIQLHCSMFSIMTTNPKSLLGTALAFGYYDQTHMNRCYRKFLGCTTREIRFADSRALSADDIPDIL